MPLPPLLLVPALTAVADIEGEGLSLSCKLRVTMAKNDSVYNVASTCSYGNTPDPVKANDAWTLKAKEKWDK